VGFADRVVCKQLGSSTESDDYTLAAAVYSPNAINAAAAATAIYAPPAHYLSQRRTRILHDDISSALLCSVCHAASIYAPSTGVPASGIRHT